VPHSLNELASVIKDAVKLYTGGALVIASALVLAYGTERPHAQIKALRVETLFLNPVVEN
jgi:hypothetical protein